MTVVTWTDPMKEQKGRPYKYTPEQLEELVESYFNACRIRRKELAGIGITEEEQEQTNFTDDIHPTICGLAVAIGTTRETIREYGNNPKFVDTIKKARARIEAYNEQRLFGNNVAGVIFNLKNNFGWKDKQEQEISGSLQVQNIERTIVDPKDTNS